MRESSESRDGVSWGLGSEPDHVHVALVRYRAPVQDRSQATPTHEPPRTRLLGLLGLLEAPLALTAIYITNYALHNKLCDAIFHCNCTYPWDGADRYCNVHHTTGPKCPWCNVRHTNLAHLEWAISDTFTVTMMAMAYLVAYTFQKRPASPSAAAASEAYLLTKEPYTILFASGASSSQARLLAGRVMAALLTFVALGLAMGFIFYAFSEPIYPCFLFIVDNATECGFRGQPSTLQPASPAG